MTRPVTYLTRDLTRDLPDGVADSDFVLSLRAVGAAQVMPTVDRRAVHLTITAFIAVQLQLRITMTNQTQQSLL